MSAFAMFGEWRCKMYGGCNQPVSRVFPSFRTHSMPRIMTLLAIIGIVAACYFTWRFGMGG
ncbi:hypothetical protein [Diaphorobacter caeni]|uniref:hypothetical protein n=1 Tax=Diaphorobacter caeni TaxID=2784387 RepID=UPI00188DFF09|nr:hypothetical protein [Diaphorobacter caeni]MBF5004321.1 hypothetical protein [Diaphorobacter caeni]